MIPHRIDYNMPIEIELSGECISVLEMTDVTVTGDLRVQGTSTFVNTPFAVTDAFVAGFMRVGAFAGVGLNILEVMQVDSTSECRGILTCSGAGTGLSVTNNVSVGGNTSVTGELRSKCPTSTVGVSTSLAEADSGTFILAVNNITITLPPRPAEGTNFSLVVGDTSDVTVAVGDLGFDVINFVDDGGSPLTDTSVHNGGNLFATISLVYKTSIWFAIPRSNGFESGTP